MPSTGVPELILPPGIQRPKPMSQPQLAGREIEGNALRMAVQWTQEHPEGLQVLCALINGSA